MRSAKTSRKKLYYLLIAYFLLWIVWFEFILPVNDILPKPSVVLLSFGALWSDYHLPMNYIATFSTVYLSLIAAYFALHFSSGLFAKENHLITTLISSFHSFSLYVPGIILGLFLIYWFPHSAYIGFVFIFLTAFFSMLIKYQSEIPKVDNAYIAAAESMGAGEKIINSRIIWKSVQPALAKHILELHLYAWSVLLMFEYIKGGYGLGTIIRLSLEFRDLSALFTTAIIIGVTIFIGTLVIKYSEKKFLHWSRAE